MLFYFTNSNFLAESNLIELRFCGGNSKLCIKLENKMTCLAGFHQKKVNTCQTVSFAGLEPWRANFCHRCASALFSPQEFERFITRHTHYNPSRTWSSATVRYITRSVACRSLQKRALHLCLYSCRCNRALLLSFTGRQEPLSVTSLHRPSADLPTAIKTLITRS